MQRSLAAAAWLAATLFLPTHAATPELGLTSPGTKLLGERFCYTTEWNNAGETGYGPYQLVTLPAGLTFDGASVFGQAATATRLSLAPSGSQIVDSWSGQVFNATDTVYRISYPVGSVITGSRPLEMEVCATIDPAAMPGQELLISHQPNYRHGSSPVGTNATTGAVQTASVIPAVMWLDKTSDTPEQETPPGQAWPFDYILNVNIAKGAVVSQLVLEDVLPSSFQYLSHTVSGAAAAGVSCSPASPASDLSTTPGGTLRLECDSVQGTGSADDLVLRIRGYLLEPSNTHACTPDNVQNSASLVGTYVPATGAPLPQAQQIVEHDLVGKHVAIQKTAGSTLVVPGSEIIYTVTGQVTQFSDAGSLLINDLLDDGLVFIGLVPGASPAPLVTQNPDNDRDIRFNFEDHVFPAASTFSFQYRVRVLDNFQDTSLGPVRANDVLANTLNASYQLIDAQGGVTASSCMEDSAASVLVTPMTLVKSIVNPQTHYVPGDTVVFNLRMVIPAGSARDVVFTDYLPLPVFNVTTTPPSTRVTDATNWGPAPTISVDSALNAVRVNWGDIVSVTETVLEAQISATVVDTPFADELHLTNLLYADAENTRLVPSDLVSPVSLYVRAPVLTLEKSVTPTANIQAGTVLNYSLLIENTGGAPAYDMTVSDILPAALQGACDAAHPGSATVLPPLAAGASTTVSYSCTVPADVAPGTELENTAQLTYASRPGATPFPPITDDAVVTVRGLELAKSIVATSESSTAGNALAIGEIVQYELSVTIPPSTINVLRIEDLLPTGLRALASAPVSYTLNGAPLPGGVSTAEDFTASNPVFSLSNLVTAASGADAVLRIRFYALVLNQASNVRGTAINNRFTTQVNPAQSGPSYTSAYANAVVAEPQISVDKTVVGTPGAQAGETVSFSIVVSNAAGAQATAFDWQLQDDVPGQLELNPTSVTVTPSGHTVEVIGNRITISGAALAPNESVTINLQATLLQSVIPGTIVTNTADASWSSLPGTRGTGLDGIQPPGESGAVDGERQGTASDTAALTIAPVTLSKTVVDSSESHTSGNQITIGETVTYELVTTVPYGTVNPVTISDQLPAGGVLEFVSGSVQVLSVGSNLRQAGNPTETVTPEIEQTAGRFQVSFGNVRSISGGTPEDNRIVIRARARLMNVPANANGTTRNNAARVLFGAITPAAVRAPIAVVAPLLQIDKSANTASADAGDELNFTVRISHTNASRASAQQVVFTDTLPADLIYSTGSVTVNGTAVDDSLVWNDTTRTITVAHGQLAYLAAPGNSEALTITYKARLRDAVASGRDVTNTGHLQWDSLASPQPGDQNRHLLAQDSHTVAVSQPGVSKTVSATSQDHTAGDVLTIGEQVTYSMVAKFEPGTTVAAQFVDVMPSNAALEIISTRIAHIGNQLQLLGTGAPVEGTAGVQSPAGTITWTLGDVYYPPTRAPLNAQDTEIHFEVVALVKNDAINLGANTGVNKTNRAILSYVNPNQPDTRIEQTDQHSVAIVQPRLNIAKSIMAPVAVADSHAIEAGDSVQYRLTISHDNNATPPSGAAALGVVVTDVLPAGVNWKALDSSSGCTVSEAQSGSTVTFTIGALPLGSDCQITYSVTSTIDVKPGQHYDNQASLSYNSLDDPSLPENLSGSANDSARFTVAGAPSLEKSLSSTSLADTAGDALAIGESVTYTITVRTPRGTVEEVVLIDVMPRNSAGELAIQATHIRQSAIGRAIELEGSQEPEILDGGARVQINLGIVRNDPSLPEVEGFVQYEITGIVLDTDGNRAAEVLTNNAQLRFSGDDGTGLQDTAEVRLVEPVLSLAKQMQLKDRGGVLSGNSFVTIRMEVGNTGMGPAYDLRVEDVLTDRDWVLSSIKERIVPDGFTLEVLDGADDSERIVVLRSLNPDVPQVLPAGASIVATFEAQIATTSSNPLLNSIELSGASSMPGQPSQERIYPAVQADAELGVPVLQVRKQAQTEGDEPARPGEAITYTIAIENTGLARASNVLLRDLLEDDSLQLVAGTVTSTAGIINVGNNTADTGVEVQIPEIAAGTSVSVQFQATVVSPVAANVTQVLNQAIVQSAELPETRSDDPSLPGSTDPTRVPVQAQIDLQVRKQADLTNVAAGSAVVYTLEYANIGDRNATNVVLTEQVPALSRFDADASDSRWSCTADGEAGALCTLALGDLSGDFSPEYGQGSVVFAINVDAYVPAGSREIVNTVRIAAADQTDRALDNNSDTHTLPFDDLVAPDVYVSKSYASASVEPGAQIAYTLVYGNQGTRGATGVVLTEHVPAQSRFLAAQSSAGWSCEDGAEAGSECSYSHAGALEPGDSHDLVFAVQLGNPLPNDFSMLRNTVTVIDDGLNGIDPDLDNNSSTVDTDVVVNSLLEITKEQTGGDNPVSFAKRTLDYTITVRNTGNNHHTGLVLTETMPDGSDGLDALSGPLESLNTDGILEVGESWTYTISYTVTQDDINAEEELVNHASVRTDQSPEPLEDTATTVVRKPDLTPVPTLSVWALLLLIAATAAVPLTLQRRSGRVKTTHGQR